jgi:hypothetical protein
MQWATPVMSFCLKSGDIFLSLSRHDKEGAYVHRKKVWTEKAFLHFDILKLKQEYLLRESYSYVLM